MALQHPLLAALDASLPAASLRPRAATCLIACRSLLAEGAIEDADASSISFMTPTGSVRIEIPTGVDDNFLFSLYRQCDSVLSNEERATLVKAVVTHGLARQRTNRINSAWNLYFQRQMADDSDFDEIGFLASIATGEDLRVLTDHVKAAALELPPPSKVRVTVIPSAVPFWDPRLGILRLGDNTASFRNQRGGNVRALLDTFQAKGWPLWIATGWEYERLRDAVRDLRKKTVGWMAWHAATDGQSSWELS